MEVDVANIIKLSDKKVLLQLRRLLLAGVKYGLANDGLRASRYQETEREVAATLHLILGREPTNHEIRTVID
jgi:hypothetical protein